MPEVNSNIRKNQLEVELHNFKLLNNEIFVCWPLAALLHFRVTNKFSQDSAYELEMINTS